MIISRISSLLRRCFAGSSFFSTDLISSDISYLQKPGCRFLDSHLKYCILCIINAACRSGKRQAASTPLREEKIVTLKINRISLCYKCILSLFKTNVNKVFLIVDFLFLIVVFFHRVPVPDVQRIHFITTVFIYSQCFVNKLH